MTHRERILTALRRETPDRVPVDFGSTMGTTITARAHQRLREYLGLPAEPPPEVLSKRGSTVVPDAVIRESFGADAVVLMPGTPDASPDRDLSDCAFVDEWGVIWNRAPEGHYIAHEGPLQTINDPTPDDLDRLRWPDPADPGRYRGLGERARCLHETTDKAVVFNCWVGPIHLGQFTRGFVEWLGDLLERPLFIEALAARTADIWIEIAQRALAEAAPYIDVVIFYDDLGSQKGPLFRPAVYRSLIKPHHRRMVDAVKRFGKPVLYHTCGSMHALIPDIIELGIDALNPVQVAAAGMDTARLKREYGRNIAFWGAVDSQRVLPLGTPADVRAEVRRRIDDLAPGGGYVLAATHNIQADVPPENVVAMFEAAREFGAQ